ncbi:hypothetical protein MPS_1162 [Mycobacterium pseudoshottsii JCM 15466]|nr:hypothetical protein MPS_1162 [Mycobacterium pseudoshottsii JCM 15466]
MSDQELMTLVIGGGGWVFGVCGWLPSGVVPGVTNANVRD